jgi:hypothetical protein
MVTAKQAMVVAGLAASLTFVSILVRNSDGAAVVLNFIVYFSAIGALALALRIVRRRLRT